MLLNYFDFALLFWHLQLRTQMKVRTSCQESFSHFYVTLGIVNSVCIYLCVCVYVCVSAVCIMMVSLRLHLIKKTNSRLFFQRLKPRREKNKKQKHKTLVSSTTAVGLVQLQKELSARRGDAPHWDTTMATKECGRVKMLRTPRSSSQLHKEAVSLRVNQDGRMDVRMDSLKRCGSSVSDPHRSPDPSFPWFPAAAAGQQ